MPAASHFSLVDDWHDLKRGRPGHRFQDRYERARREKPPCSVARRAVTLAAALVFLGVAMFLAVFPGPAIPFFFLGGALLATQSRTVARWMDWAEVGIRRMLAGVKRRWRRLPLVGRIAVVAVAMGCSATFAFFTYRFVRG
jgi:hypothetical protein